MTSDGEHIVVGSEDNYIYLFNKKGELLWKYRTGSSVYSVSITSGGVYIVAGGEGSVYLFNRKGEILWKYETDGSVRSVSITPDGKLYRCWRM